MIPQDILSRKRLAEIADIALLPAIVILVGAGSFFFGRLSALEACRGRLIIHPPGGAQLIATPTPATPDYLGESAPAGDSVGTESSTPGAPAPQPSGPHNYIASKNGSKYYLPTCTAVKRITESNRVYFATKQEAMDAGYTPAANCKGM